MCGQHPARNRMTQINGGAKPKVKDNKSKLISPFYPGRMDISTKTIAESLSDHNSDYVSTHIGKWHMSRGHGRYPTAIHHGFREEYTSEGITETMKDRSNYATFDPNDKFQLQANDENRPRDSVTINALTFLDNINKEAKPFFLYLATWLVHWPVQARDSARLYQYAKTYNIDPSHLVSGQEMFVSPHPDNLSPYYAVMVNTIDWTLGKVMHFLENTDDKRNPGKKLSETTYLIFTSDNGGVISRRGEKITSNLPLIKGKKYAQEGGIRVPMVVVGLGIEGGTSFDGLVNQLDIYPTIISLAGGTVDPTYAPKLDGLDISEVLLKKSNIVKDKLGKERESLFWHFPHNSDS